MKKKDGSNYGSAFSTPKLSHFVFFYLLETWIFGSKQPSDL